MRKLTISSFSLICGISSGCFLAVRLSASVRAALALLLRNYFLLPAAEMDYPNPFFSSLLLGTVLLAIAFGCGFFRYLGFLPFLLIAGVGVTAGFSASLLLYAMGPGGTLTIIYSLLPRNFFFLMALILAAAIKKDPRMGKEALLLTFLKLWGLVFVGCALDGLICLIG